jgi:hypothetical protein
MQNLIGADSKTDRFANFLTDENFTVYSILVCDSPQDLQNQDPTTTKPRPHH